MGDVKSNFDNIEVEPDSENFRGSSGLQIQEVTMRQFQRCLEEGSKELTKGGKKKVFSNGVYIDIEVPNQRQIYISAIISLEIVLIPSLIKNNTLYKNMQSIDTGIETLKTDYEIDIKKTKDYNKEVGLIQTPLGSRPTGLSVESNVYDNIKDLYELKLLDLYRNKLAILSKLLAAENYFSDKYA